MHRSCCSAIGLLLRPQAIHRIQFDSATAFFIGSFFLAQVLLFGHKDSSSATGILPRTQGFFFGHRLQFDSATGLVLRLFLSAIGLVLRPQGFFFGRMDSFSDTG